MPIPRTFKARLFDQQKLSELVFMQPELGLAEDPFQFTEPYLKKAGIEYLPHLVGGGYIKYHYQDFIVEEIDCDGNIIDVGEKSSETTMDEIPEKAKVWGTLIKQGLGTFDAVELLAEQLNIPVTQIGYAGLKDGKAITAQRISFTGVSVEDVSRAKAPYLSVLNPKYHFGVVNPGDLQGNRFTTFLRTHDVDPSIMKSRVQEVADNGFYNFYSLQRFGFRILLHEVGNLLMHGQYGQAVKLYLTGDSVHEVRFMRQIRAKALEHWQDWQSMWDIFSDFSYFFYYELVMLEYLIKNPQDAVGGLAAVPDQTKMAAYAYTSYYFNRLLSKLAAAGDVPEVLPILRYDQEIIDLYRCVVPSEELLSIRYYHDRLPFLRMKKPQSVPTRLFPKVCTVELVEGGIILVFDLNKGAYATTFLSQIFSIYQNKPFPEWLYKEKVDAKAILGMRPISETEALFPPAKLGMEDTIE